VQHTAFVISFKQPGVTSRDTVSVRGLVLGNHSNTTFSRPVMLLAPNSFDQGSLGGPPGSVQVLLLQNMIEGVLLPVINGSLMHNMEVNFSGKGMNVQIKGAYVVRAELHGFLVVSRETRVTLLISQAPTHGVRSITNNRTFTRIAKRRIPAISMITQAGDQIRPKATVHA
jgi:hypothetical protein